MIKVILAGDPSMEGLQYIRGYQKTLEQIGAPWYETDVLKYTRQLVESRLTEDDRSSAVRTITVVWELFGDSLDLPWHLIKEYAQRPSLLTSPLLSELIKYTFAERWSEILWTLVLVARNLENNPWWNRLVPVIRQKALGVASPPPYQIGESVLAWATTQNEEALAGHISAVLQHWRKKGEDLNASPFEYELLDLVRGTSNLPRRIQSELKQTFAAGEEAIRGLFQVWVKPEWDAFPKALRHVLGWDPDRWGILKLAEVINDFRAWMQQVYEGPPPDEAIPAFIDRTLAEKPPIERLLGSAPWLDTILISLNVIRQGTPIHEFHPIAQKWYPWLLSFEDINAAKGEKSKPDAKEIETVLTQFVQHLRTWSDIDSGLAQVKAKAPEHFSFCKHLADGFNSIFLPDSGREQDRIQMQPPDPSGS